MNDRGRSLQLSKLTDRYERKARLLPALLSCLVLAPGFGFLGVPDLDWINDSLLGGLVVAACGVGLAYVASLAGRSYERKLWPRWPHDAPTHLWLHPDHDYCSREQKEIYYEAIRMLLGLDISRVATEGNSDRIETIINDAVRGMRTKFRTQKVGDLLAIHNEDYGFVRNFGGLYWFWLPASAAITALGWYFYVDTGSGLISSVVSSFILIFAAILVKVLPAYVRQRAERYAESFLGRLISWRQEHSSA